MKKFFAFFAGVMFFSAFTQNAKAQLNCAYRLELIDSYGDGWNGAFLDIGVNGVSTTYTIEEGYSAIFSVLVADGDAISFEYFPGLYEGEVSYILYDPDGFQIFSDGPYPLTGAVFTGTVGCPACPLPPPMSISIDEVRAFDADISWVPSDPEGTYLIEYDTLGFVQGTGNIFEATGSSATITGLLENTSYDLYLYVACASGDTSNIAGPYPFHTFWQNNVGVLAIQNPITSCGLALDEAIEVVLQNFGVGPQSLIPFRYSVNGVPAGIPIPLDGYFTDVIGQDSATTIEFETTFDFSSPGEYELAAWTELENDGDISNDTTYVTIVSVPTIAEFPYIMDFEDWNGGWSIATESVDPSWEYGQPNGDEIKNAASGINAWVTNLNGNFNSYETSYLESPCMDLSAITEDVRISFSLFVDLSAWGEGLWLELSVDGGETWEKTGSFDGGINWYNDSYFQYWNGTGVENKGWSLASDILEGTAGVENMRVRFAFTSGFSSSDDGVAIDKVIIAPPAPQDLAGINTNPLSIQGCGSESDTIIFNIANFGSEAQNAFDVMYQVNDGEIIVENVDTLTVDTGQIVTYVFETLFNSSEIGEYTIKAWTALNGEMLPLNDTVYYYFATATPLPFSEDFEIGQFPEGWESEEYDPVTIFHNNESFVLYDNLWSSDTEFSVITPNLGPVQTGDSLTFDYRYVDYSEGIDSTILSANDSLSVQVSTDCGETFTTVYVIDSTNHFPTTAMANVSVNLGEFAGEAVKVRFYAVWGASDYYLDIDNINIFRCPESLDLKLQVTDESGEGAGDGALSVESGAGIGPFNYNWNTGDTTSTLTGLVAGTYTVTVTDLKGCSDIVEGVVDFVVNAPFIEAVQNIVLAPNPTTGLSMLKMEFTKNVDAKVQLFSLVGQKVFEVRESNIQNAEYALDLSNYPEGLYLVRILINDQIETRKLIRINQ
ncbi:MAG: T9SS type A sorting domain-containing protein [Bacteroidetes bacterium]|nr:T9SS type A sorting domain-containing protein [Bacteroidota bacterium]